jgi:acetyl esterase/lipase
MRFSWAGLVTGLCLTVTVNGTVCRSAQASGPVILPDVIYGHKAGMALTLDVVKPEKPNGAGLLFMVSGGWVSTWSPPTKLIRPQPATPNLFESLVDRGFTLFIVRHGSSPQFKVPEAVADVRRSVRFIRLHAEDYGIDPDRLGVFGMSAGGHLSLMLGTASDAGNPKSADPVDQVSDRVQAVVAIFPPAKINEFFPLSQRFPALQFDENLADSVSPLLHVSPDDPPTLLIHGDKDELVPISHSERMLQAFEKENVPTEILVIKGAGHGFAGVDQLRAQEALVNWFEKYLGSPGGVTPPAGKTQPEKAQPRQTQPETAQPAEQAN